MPIPYVNRAIESSKEYAAYLTTNNKGIVREKITEIRRTQEDNLLLFRVEKNFRFLDESARVEICGKVADIKDVHILEYDEFNHSVKVSATPNYLELLIHTDIEKIYIISDLRFLVKRIEAWYQTYGKYIHFPENKKIELTNDFSVIGTPSENQLEAIKTALSHPFTYIWGAPGTGKTRFVLAQCLLNLLRNGTRVLVTAPTNNALDQSMDGVLTVLKEADFGFDGQILRLGVANSWFSRKYPKICENSKNAKRMAVLNDKILEKEEQIAATQKKQKNLKELKDYVLFYEKAEKSKREGPTLISFMKTVVSQIYEAEEFLAQKQKEKSGLEESLDALNKELDRVVTQIAFARAKEVEMNKSLFSFLKKKTIAENAARIVELEKKRDGLKIAIDDSARVCKQFTLEIDQKRQDKEDSYKKFEVARSELSALFNYDKVALKLLELLTVKNYAELEEKFTGIITEHIAIVEEKNKEYQELIGTIPGENCEEFIRQLTIEKEALEAEKQRIIEEDMQIDYSKIKLMGATVDTVAARLLPDGEFRPQHVFLDEAGYCPLVKGAILTAYGASVTFLGDHMQLPPICEMDDELIETQHPWVSLWAQSALYLEDAFGSGLWDIPKDYCMHLEAKFKNIQCKDLTYTYRFGERLAKVLAENVYMKEFHGNSEITTEIVAIHAPKRKDDGKRESNNECKAIIDYLKEHPEEDCGVITPYNNQKRLLAKACNESGVMDADLVTVHGSQGREWETVLFSVVDTGDMYFTNSNNQRSNGKKLVNTALSRAKRKLVILCDLNYWKWQKNQLISKIIEVGQVEADTISGA